jgi:hypothetical protein
VLVGGSNEHTLPGLDDLLAPVARPVLLFIAGEKGLQGRGLGLVERRHLGDLEQPFPIQVLRDILACAANVREAVREPLTAQYLAGCRFLGALRSFQDQHVITFAPGLEHASHHGDHEHGADALGIVGLLGAQIGAQPGGEPRRTVPPDDVGLAAEKWRGANEARGAP